MKTKLMELFYLALVLLAGLGVPLQTASNSALGKQLGSPWHSTLAVFVIGAILVAMVFMAHRYSLPNSPVISGAPWWSWLGAPLGVAYIFILIIAAPRLGMSTAVGIVIVGQLLGSVLIDHFGWLGFPVHQINWKRALGVLLLLTGVWLVKKY
ncbi:MAG: DMT family transporter [Bacteroidota bacterium]